MAEGPDTSGRAFVDFWKRAIDKGLVNPNTGRALAAAASQVIAALDDWEKVDIQKISEEEAYRRFTNKRHGDFTPESLATYQRRFALARKSFLKYVADPTSWKPPGSGRAARREKVKSGNGVSQDTTGRSEPSRGRAKEEAGVQMVDYPFPLREGCLAILRLPADLKEAEIKRLNAYLSTLVVGLPDDVGPR